MVQAGTFRADLYYRLCVFRIDLPPLRERRMDIFPLAEHFLKKHGPADSPAITLEHGARTAVEAHTWPGNVRELENAILRAIHLRRGPVIAAEDLGLTPPPVNPAAPRTYQELKQAMIAAFEADYLRQLMIEHQGNITRAARSASKERREFARLLKKHRIDPRAFRRS
jgi:DNA-binding NtrC family response regulator